MHTERTGWVLAVVVLLLGACSSDKDHADSRVRDVGRDTVCSPGESVVCIEGDSASCMSAQGTPAYKVCRCGTWTDCSWECKPGSTKTCSGGVQRCIDGKWGACGG